MGSNFGVNQRQFGMSGIDAFNSPFGATSGLQSTVFSGLDAAQSMTDINNASTGRLMGMFSDVFTGSSLNYAAAGFGPGLMAGYANPMNPGAFNAYQGRYSGAQFGGGMTQFRGGVVGGHQMNFLQGLPQMPMMGGMGGFGGMDAMGGIGGMGGFAPLPNMSNFGMDDLVSPLVQQANLTTMQGVAELRRLGVPEDDIQAFVFTKRQNLMEQVSTMISTLTSSFHKMATSIIQNIRA
jgi:hypothetical protein